MSERPPRRSEISTKPQKMPELEPGEYEVEIDGPNACRVPLPPGAEVTLGSASDNTLQPDDPHVSAHHLVIRNETGRVSLKTVAASNHIWAVDQAGKETGHSLSGIPIWLTDSPVRAGNTVVRLRRVPTGDDREPGFHGIVGRSPSMQKLTAALTRWAKVDGNVLLVGKTGTGKELAARALHAGSRRARKPFVAVNCGAIAHERMEDAMFGHVKGAFTGADGPRSGHVRAAEGGVLFLDEVHLTTIETQQRFLRMIQERVVVPEGSSTEVKVDVRIVAATNTQLAQRVEEGRFLPDLYMRLYVGAIELPDLVDRGEDRELLIDTFLRRFGRGIKRLSPDARAKLLAHGWPGNVRELENTIERAVVDVEGRTEILAEDIRFIPMPGQRSVDSMEQLALRGRTQDECLRLIWLAAVARNGGVLARACEELGLGKSTGQRYKKEWGPFDVSGE